jgi:cystathionine gamma-synthase
MVSPPESILLATTAAQVFAFLDPATGAVVPPIDPSTTYERDANYRLLSDWIYIEDPEDLISDLSATLE